MNWLQVRIELKRIDPAPVEAALLQLGAVAIELRDAGDQPILEPAPGTTPLWAEVVIGALFDPATPPDQIRQRVALAVAPDAPPVITFGELVERDWIGDFRAALEPMCFGDRLWLLPTDAEMPTGAHTAIRLEPGLAFGSGRHPTTALCLEWLAEEQCPGTVLDFGCGSGVLALAALALGADAAYAVDVDPQALEACARNAADNGLDDRLTVCRPEALPDTLRVDALVANILSGPLMELACSLGPRLKTGARIALSGILATQAGDVGRCYAPWVDFGPPTQRDDWVLLSGTAITP